MTMMATNKKKTAHKAAKEEIGKKKTIDNELSHKDIAIRKGMDIAQELRELKRFSRDLFDAKVNELFFITRDELIEKIKDPKASVIDIYLAKLVAEGTKNADLNILKWLIDRILGPIQSYAEIKTPINHQSWIQYIEDRGQTINVEPEEDGE